MVANSCVNAEEAQLLNSLLHLPLESANRILLDASALRPELYVPPFRRSRACTLPNALVLGPETNDKAISTSPVLYFKKRCATEWVMVALGTLIVISFLLESLVQQLTMGNPACNLALGLIQCFLCGAGCVAVLEHANAVLLKEFVMTFDFAMVVANAWRCIAAFIANHGAAVGFNNVHFYVCSIPRVVYCFTFLLFAASLDALFVTRHRWVKKMYIVWILILGVSCYLIHTVGQSDWHDEANELPIWFVRLNAKKHFLSGLTNLCIFIGKFFFKVVVLDLPFANKDIAVVVKQHYITNSIEVQRLNTNEA